MALTVEEYSDLRTSNIIGWSASALFAYDILVTLPQEIHLVWRSKCTLPKMLYFVTRYGGFSLMLIMNIVATWISHSPVDCRIYCPTILPVNDILQAACDWLLMLRITAVFNQRRRACFCLWALFIAVYIVEFVIAGLYFATWLRVPSVSVQGANCSLMSALAGGDNVALSTVPILVLNSVLFVLTVVHLLPLCWKSGGNAAPMLSFLLREGSGYFAAISSVYVLNVICLLKLSDRKGLQNVILPLVIVVPPLASNRLFLNLRGLVHAPTDFTTFPTPPPEMFRLRGTEDTYDSWDDEETQDEV